MPTPISPWPSSPKRWATRSNTKSTFNGLANWQSLFNPEIKRLAPRKSDGTFAAQKPTDDNGWTEGSAAQYLWMVPYDLPTLIDKLGGATEAVARLDHYFEKVNGGLGSEFAYMGNEPCAPNPFTYNCLQQPWKTQAVVRRVQTELFTSQPGGLPGNDDGGSLSSWYVFSALGLYPLASGVGGFTVSSPLFSSFALAPAPGGKFLLTITADNAAADRPYIPCVDAQWRADHHALASRSRKLQGTRPRIHPWRQAGTPDGAPPPRTRRPTSCTLTKSDQRVGEQPVLRRGCHQSGPLPIGVGAKAARDKVAHLGLAFKRWFSSRVDASDQAPSSG